MLYEPLGQSNNYLTLIYNVSMVFSEKHDVY